MAEAASCGTSGGSLRCRGSCRCLLWQLRVASSGATDLPRQLRLFEAAATDLPRNLPTNHDNYSCLKQLPQDEVTVGLLNDSF
ncbi:hypothetical protein ABVT39_013929 [Epinephelus coioides]